MYENAKRGWYKIKNPEKFLKPIDSYMESFNESNGTVEYKSGLEHKTLIYVDNNSNIIKWSAEPLHIKYLKPSDNKIHRYFIDFYFEFSNGKKFLIEIKSSGETKPPIKPKTKTPKSIRNFNKAIMTFKINQAKWKAAQIFAEKNNMKFIVITEKQLG